MKTYTVPCKYCLQPLHQVGSGWRHTRGGKSKNLVCKKPTPLTVAEEKALDESLLAAVRSQLGSR